MNAASADATVMRPMRSWGAILGVFLVVWCGGCGHESRAGGSGSAHARRGGGKPPAAPLQTSSSTGVARASTGNPKGFRGTNPGQRGQGTTTPPAASRPGGSGTRVVAYYFHRTMRCPTCLSIEKQAREAVETGFGTELQAGWLEWHAVNIDESGNKHFRREFQIDRQTLMFVELRDGTTVRSTKLERIWDLVDDPAAFREYVQTEMQTFRGGG